MMSRFSFTALLSLLILVNVSANDGIQKRISTYISTYKDIAISEMKRTGIPASIKLAQGLLESDFGRSELANRGNNHFGIKCGPNWEGDTFYKKDDDRNSKGELIESCFRAFDNADQSYIEHSFFLQDSRKAYRYGFLFKYKSNDYKNWAKGLKKAGYATDPKYPQKLISIIEKYKLHKYDEEISNPEDFDLLANQVVSDKDSDELLEMTPPKAERVSNRRARYKIKMVNGSSYVVAREGDSARKIANMIGISYNKLSSYNEQISDPNLAMPKGERLFIEAKKKSFKDKKYHKVRQGETLYEISQYYGISLKHLRSRNRIEENEEVWAGEKLLLKGIKIGNKPKTYISENQSTEFLF